MAALEDSTDDAAADWLSQYSDSSAPALFQVAMEPTGELDTEAVAEAADADKMIAQARAMMKQDHTTTMLQSDAAQPAGPPPPPGFKKMEGNAQSGGVIVMLQNLIADSEAMVKEAVQNEKDAMIAYETFMKDENEATNTRQKGITDRRARIGKLEKFSADTQDLLDQ